MTEPRPVIVAVDFTADVLRVILATIEGEALLREEHPLPPLPDEDAWSWEVGGRISTAFAREGNPCFALGIAVACPGTVDTAAGRLLDSTGQPAWDGLAVVEALRRHIDAPIVALNRTHAALRGEAASGAADGFFDALYVTLRGTPSAAALVSGRIVSGAGGHAGALPALPELEPGAPLEGEALERAVSLLADAVALLDPGVVVIEGEDAHVAAVIPVLQEVIDEVSPGPRVVVAALGDRGALAGALQAAAIVAYEGERRA
jgi:predicted NBD/HSP70 family sugar kinase